MTKLPSDSLKNPRRPWRAVAIVAGALLVIGGGSIGAAALTQEPTEEVAVVELSGGQGKPTEPQVSHKLLVPHVLKSTTPPPPPPPPPVYEPPAAPEPGSPGTLVPFVASSDPNNASGGDYIDPGSYCWSGSASGNPPRCD